MRRYILIATMLGVTGPVLWMLAYHKSSAFADWWFGAPGWIEYIRSALWPTAIMLMADPLDKNVALWIAATMLNGAIYALLGALIWFSIHRRK